MGFCNSFWLKTTSAEMGFSLLMMEENLAQGSMLLRSPGADVVLPVGSCSLMDALCCVGLLLFCAA